MASAPIALHPLPNSPRRKPVAKSRARVKSAREKWRARGLQLLGLVFFFAVAWLLYNGFREMEWREIREALLRYDRWTMAAGAGIALTGFVLASFYDLLSRHYEKHKVSTPQCMATGFISLAFSMNLGSLVGAWGMRYRLYTRFGLRTAQITRLITMALLTNWSGFVLMAGLVFTFFPPQLPQSWPLHGSAITVLGMILLGLAATYLTLCARGGRDWQVRGVRLRRPRLRFALLQLAASCASWLAPISVIALFMPENIPYIQVMGVLFVSSIAGLIARVPAGLGVVEAVFVALLGSEVHYAPLLAAILAYRGVYYLLPFLVALCFYGVLEWRARHARKAA